MLEKLSQQCQYLGINGSLKRFRMVSALWLCVSGLGRPLAGQRMIAQPLEVQNKLPSASFWWPLFYIRSWGQHTPSCMAMHGSCICHFWDWTHLNTPWFTLNDRRSPSQRLARWSRKGGRCANFRGDPSHVIFRAANGLQSPCPLSCFAILLTISDTPYPCP